MSKKLFIIAGHGGVNPYDPGALGNGYEEAGLVRILAKKLKDLGGNDVILGDIGRNWFKDNLISKTIFEKGTEILELHLDSGDKPTAKGGHVIIDADFKPDEYDLALADMISSFFPGRSDKISYRNLKETNAAQQKKVSFRLMECCFITNKEDVEKFLANIDKLAVKILEIFGIEVKIPENQAAPMVEDKKESGFVVRVESTRLRIRKGPGVDKPCHMKNGSEVYTGAGSFTIVKVENGPGSTKGWGLLKSYADKEDGWISLDFAKKV